MKRAIGWLAVLAMFSAMACSDDDTTKPDIGSDWGIKDDAMSPDRTVTPKDTGPKPDMGPMAQVCALLVDDTGKALPSHGVIVCSEKEGCNSGTSGTTGAVCVLVGDPATDWVFHVPENKGGGKHYADVLFPVPITAADIAAAKKFELNKVVVPVVAKTVTLDPKAGGSLDLGNGVKLTIAAGAAKLPPLVTTANVGGGLVKSTDVHARFSGALSGVTAEAVFAIIPIGLTFPSTTADYELPAGSIADGTKLKAMVFDDKLAVFKQNGEATVASGKIKNTSGKGLSALGWIAFTK